MKYSVVKFIHSFRSEINGEYDDFWEAMFSCLKKNTELGIGNDVISHGGGAYPHYDINVGKKIMFCGTNLLSYNKYIIPYFWGKNEAPLF